MDRGDQREYVSTAGSMLSWGSASIIVLFVAELVWRNYHGMAFDWQYEYPTYLVLFVILLLWFAGMMAARVVTLDFATQSISVQSGRWIFANSRNICFDQVKSLSVSEVHLGNKGGRQFRLSVALKEGEPVALAMSPVEADLAPEAELLCQKLGIEIEKKPSPVWS